LDKKFKVELAGIKRFIVDKILDFKIIDSKIVMSQVQVFQFTLRNIYAKDIFISEYFLMVIIIKKLSSSWKKFKNYLKHNSKNMS